MSSASQEAKGKKTVAGEVSRELYEKLDRISSALQRTKSDLVGTIVSNWLIEANEQIIQSHNTLTKKMGLMPPDAVKKK
jgi:predicted DNA-binding protein